MTTPSVGVRYWISVRQLRFIPIGGHHIYPRISNGICNIFPWQLDLKSQQPGKRSPPDTSNGQHTTQKTIINEQMDRTEKKKTPNYNKNTVQLLLPSPRKFFPPFLSFYFIFRERLFDSLPCFDISCPCRLVTNNNGTTDLTAAAAG